MREVSNFSGKEVYSFSGCNEGKFLVSLVVMRGRQVEFIAVLEEAWHTADTHNIFLDSGEDHFPPHHIRNRRLPTQADRLYHFFNKKKVQNMILQNVIELKRKKF